MLELKIRCSSIGKLMGDSKTKGEFLSQTARSYVRQLASEALFGVDFEVSSKQMEKGIQCEGDSIELFNSVFGRALVKNTERRTDDYFTGESDLLDVDEVVDIKTAWSVSTFPLSEEDVASTQRTLYEWQIRGYCRLWNKPLGRISYCLVDTPEKLIGFEPLPLHVVSHIPEHLRVTTWTVERDAEKESAMVEKVKAARLYYAQVIAEFDRSHHRASDLVSGVEPPPWAANPDPKPTAAPLRAPTPTAATPTPKTAPAELAMPEF